MDRLGQVLEFLPTVRAHGRFVRTGSWTLCVAFLVRGRMLQVKSKKGVTFFGGRIRDCVQRLSRDGHIAKTENSENSEISTSSPRLCAGMRRGYGPKTMRNR